jgi:hypothetical protein
LWEFPFDFFPPRDPLRDAERFFPFFFCPRFVVELKAFAAGTAGTAALTAASLLVEEELLGIATPQPHLSFLIVLVLWTALTCSSPLDFIIYIEPFLVTANDELLFFTLRLLLSRRITYWT